MSEPEGSTLQALQESKRGLRAQFNKEAMVPVRRSRVDLDAPKPLDKQVWDANTTIYMSKSGILVATDEPIKDKDQMADVKYAYKVAGGSLPVPEDKQYHNYAAAHPKEKIKPPPPLTPDQESEADAQRMVATVTAGIEKGFRRSQEAKASGVVVEEHVTGKAPGAYAADHLSAHKPKPRGPAHKPN